MFRIKSLVATLITIILIFNLSGFIIYAQVTENTMVNNFIDVNPQDSNLAFINYLSEREIIKGFPDGTYKPGAYLTRAEAAAIIVRALGISTQLPAETIFTDVPVSHWAYKVIAAAEREGILKGFPDKTFRPNENLTKAQSIALILKVLGEPFTEITSSLPGDILESHWAAKAIGAAYSAGLIEYDNNNFEPDISFTRSDMARVLAVAMTLSPATRKLTLMGELTATHGSIRVKKAGETQFQTVAINKKITINPGDSIKTDTNSTAEIVFEDGSGLLLESNSQMTIKEIQGLAYIGKQGKPGNTVQWLNIDLQVGKLFIFLASIVPLEKVEEGQEMPWWKEARQEVVRVQVNMPLGIGTMKNGAVLFDTSSNDNNTIANLIGQVNVTWQKEKLELKQGQKVSIFQDIKTLRAYDMKEKDLREFINEKIKTFLLKRSESAIKNKALDVLYKKDVKSPAIKQQENLLEALHKAEKTNTSPAIGGGGSGGNGGTDNGSGTLTQVSKVAAMPGSGAVPAGTQVSLNTATVGANIYYTLDGSTPTLSSTQYTDPITIDGNDTIKAIAVKLGMMNSTVATFSYTIQGPIEPNIPPDPIDPAKSWVVVGDRGISENSVESTSFYILEGIPYLAYTSYFAPTVKRFINNQWENIGVPGAAIASVSSISLAAGSGSPYIAYRRNAAGDIRVEKYDGNQWITMGSESFVGAGAHDPNLYIEKGIPYLAYTRNFNGDRASVLKYSEDKWEAVGTPGFTPRSAHTIALRVDNEIPYIAFQDEWGGPAAVMKYNGSNWVSVGASQIGEKIAYGITLEILNGVPYVAYQDGWKGPIIVKRFEESSEEWTNVTQLSFNEDAYVFGPSFKIISPDSIYVAYQDVACGEKATVQHYNGASWTIVGDTGFTPYRVLDLSIDMYEDTPYISFRESYDGITTHPLEGRVSVMKYGVAESGTQTAIPVITSVPVKSGDMDIEGTAEPNSVIIMRRGINTWSTSADNNGSFIVSIGGDDKRLGGCDELSITAQSPGKAISEPAEIIVEYAGLGTINDPYEIWTLGELNGIRDNLSAHYKFKDNIDATETRTWNDGKGWEPIGNWGYRFSGRIDGDGHHVYGLFIDRESESQIGLLGVTNDAAISNLGLYIITISGFEQVGSLVGFNENTPIDKCYVVTTGGQGVVKGKYSVGGLVGGNTGTLAKINECFSEVEVLGGLDSDSLGGLVGSNGVAAGVFNSYAVGNVTGDYAIGGLIGFNKSTPVNNCYAAGIVTGKDVVGGLIGENTDSEIRNSFALNSKLIRSEYSLVTFGKVIGFQSFGNPTNQIFALEQMQVPMGTLTGIRGTEISFIEAGQSGSYVGWDFESIWVIGESGSYPHLRRINVTQNAGASELEAEADKLGLIDEIEEIDEIEKIDEKELMDKIDKIDEIDEIDEKKPMDEIEEIDERESIDEIEASDEIESVDDSEVEI